MNVLIKLILTAVLVVSISLASTGCVMQSTTKYVSDEVCSKGFVEKKLLKAQMDKWTTPNKIRVECGDS